MSMLTCIEICAAYFVVKVSIGIYRKWKDAEMQKYIPGDMMDEQEFWKLIANAFAESNGDLTKQAQVLTQTLTQYKQEQIIEFEILLRQKILGADDYGVMAAAKIMDGYVSDDSYLYFRCWLIGQGKMTFEETLINPDYLAQVVENTTVPDFEQLLYVSTDAYKNRSGKEEEDESFPRYVAIGQGLDYNMGLLETAGTDWEESDLPKSYPELWNLYN